MHIRMTTSSRAAALLAPVFIHSGWDSLRRPESKVKAADAVIGPLSSRFDFVPKDPATAVRINGAVQCAAGALLAAGRLQRVAALILAGSLLPTTYADHRFWAEVDDEDRAREVEPISQEHRHLRRSRVGRHGPLDWPPLRWARRPAPFCPFDEAASHRALSPFTQVPFDRLLELHPHVAWSAGRRFLTVRRGSS